MANGQLIRFIGLGGMGGTGRSTATSGLKSGYPAVKLEAAAATLAKSILRKSDAAGHDKACCPAPIKVMGA